MTRSHDRWLKFWAQAGAAGDPEAGWRFLSDRYGEPHRAYHTMEHIEHCLDELEAARALAADPIAVEMALWFHDVVYDPKRQDNEARSAEEARRAAESMKVDPARAQRVADLILVSTHDRVAPDGDARLFADIDLAILGQPAEVFAEYERRVRAEYSWVPEPLFRSARAAILESFLKRPTIYATELYRSKYESRARANVAESLSVLRG